MNRATANPRSSAQLPTAARRPRSPLRPVPNSLPSWTTKTSVNAKKAKSGAHQRRTPATSTAAAARIRTPGANPARDTPNPTAPTTNAPTSSRVTGEDSCDPVHIRAARIRSRSPRLTDRLAAQTPVRASAATRPRHVKTSSCGDSTIAHTRGHVLCWLLGPTSPRRLRSTMRRASGGFPTTRDLDRRRDDVRVTASPLLEPSFQRRANAPTLRIVGRAHQSTRADGPIRESGKRVLRGAKPEVDRGRADPHSGEAGFDQQRPKGHVVRKLEERRPGWNLAGRRDLGIVDRTEKRGEERRRFRRIPGRQRNASPRDEDARELVRGAARLAD